MNLRFQRATEEDVPLIRSMADKIWHEHYPPIITLQQIDFMLKTRYSPAAILEGMKRGEVYFIAYSGNTAVAYASIELKGGIYFMHKFYVEVAKHRGGIGAAFFNYIIDQVDASKPMRLQVNRQNYKAVNFYFKMGFNIESTGDFDIGEGYYMNDFVMLRSGSPLKK